jgi:hypothetical protein
VEADGVVMPCGRRVLLPATVADRLRAANGSFVFDVPGGEAKHTADGGS